MRLLQFFVDSLVILLSVATGIAAFYVGILLDWWLAAFAALFVAGLLPAVCYALWLRPRLFPQREA